MVRILIRLLAAILLSSPTGCSKPHGAADLQTVLPGRLSELGLYSDLRSGSVGADARPYRPTFTLWSDGAAKRRWVRLPEGTKIDTSDMDIWRFPVGTDFFKEFSIDGRRIETRILRKVRPGEAGWAALSYSWNEAQDEAFAAPQGVVDALGTKYDIPSANDCMACHGGRPERVLGFGAIQLAHAPTSRDELTLERLVAEQRLSREPAAKIALPGPPEDAAAVGYLFANCGHCHDGGRPPHPAFFRPPRFVDFSLNVRDLGSLDSTRAHATATLLAGGLPSRSHLILSRMAAPGGQYMFRMPPVATQLVDEEGLALVSGWLQRLRLQH